MNYVYKILFFCVIQNSSPYQDYILLFVITIQEFFAIYVIKMIKISYIWYTDKKEIFSHMYGNSEWSIAKAYIRKGFLIYEEMRKYFPIYEEAYMTLQLFHSEFPYMMRKILFSFYQCKYASLPPQVGVCGSSCSGRAVCGFC